MHNKPVAIIGAGNGGQAYAGWLALRGYTTRIYNARPGTVKALEKAGAIEIQGNADHTGIGKFELVSTRIDEVIRGCEVINVIMPSNLHLMIADTLAPYLEDGQTIILTPAAPFGAISFRHRLKEAGCKADVTIAQTSTLLFACRLVEHGKVYVNGEMIDDPWGFGQTLEETGVIIYPYTVRDGNVFVLGDNRTVSMDSRMFGEVNKRQIKGRIILRVSFTFAQFSSAM